MSKPQIAILISVVVLSSGLFFYFKTHKQSFTPSSVQISSPSYQPTIKEIKLDSSSTSELNLNSTKSAQKK